ncbi:MAG: glutamate synthase central domain-containing protein [Gallintestinimicrobium sp.]
MALNGTNGSARWVWIRWLSFPKNISRCFTNKQLFAQVTNLRSMVREKIIFHNRMAGKNGNLLEEKPENCQVLKINNPILADLDLLIRTMKKPALRLSVPIIFYRHTDGSRAGASVRAIG